MPTAAQYRNAHKHEMLDFIPHKYREIIKAALLLTAGAVTLAMLIMLGMH